MVGGSTSLVRHHRASLWLCSFITACMKAASLQPRVSLPEMSSLRERLWAPEPQLDLDGLLCVFLSGGASPLRLALRLILAASKQHVTQLLGQQHLQLFGKHLLLFSSTAHTETTAARGARVLRDALGLCLAAPAACPRSHGSFPSSIASSTSKMKGPSLKFAAKWRRAGAAPPPQVQLPRLDSA